MRKQNGVAMGHVAFQGLYGNWNDILNVLSPVASGPLRSTSPFP